MALPIPPDSKSGGSHSPQAGEAVPICLSQEFKLAGKNKEQLKSEINLAALILQSDQQATNVTHKRNNSRKGFSDEQLMEFANKITLSYKENQGNPTQSNRV